MKAVVCDRYGPPDVLRLEAVERPVPADDEVLVQVRATTVNRSDCGARSATPFFTRVFHGLRRPKRRIPGMEFAGEVAAVGSAVTEFALGDEVFGVKGAGAHAEYTCVRESGPIAHKPAGLSFEEAASLPDGFIIALACVRKAEPRPGTEHPHLRRHRIDRHRRGAAGQALRGGRHRCRRHEERRARPLARRRRGDRSPAGGLHEERHDLRRRLRRCRQAFVPAVQRLAEAGRDHDRDRPRLHLARAAARPGDPVDRRQAVDDPDPEVHEGEHPPAQGARRGGALPAGDRPHLPRWRTWSKRPATSRRARRPGTSS